MERKAFFALITAVCGLACNGNPTGSPPSDPVPDAGPDADPATSGPNAAAVSEPPAPVVPQADGRDGLYAGKVSVTASTCRKDTEEAKAKMDFAVVDVMPASDGSLTLSTPYGEIIPAPLDGFVVEAGVLDKTVTLKTQAGKPFDQVVKGTLTAEEIAFTLVSNLPDGTASCVRTLSFTGTRSPIGDGSVTEGKWRVASPYYDEFCPGEQASGKQPDWDGIRTLNVFRLGAESFIALNDGSIAFRMPVPADGALNWTGKAEITGFGGTVPIDTKVFGTLTPSNAAFVIDMQPPSAKCAARTYATGNRRLPVVGAIDNDWRLSVSWDDGCEHMPQKSDWSAEIVSQPEGKLWLMERGQVITLTKQDDGSYVMTAGHAAFGETIRYDVTFQGGQGMSYKVDYRYLVDFAADKWCALTARAVGRVRYVDDPSVVPAPTAALLIGNGFVENQALRRRFLGLKPGSLAPHPSAARPKFDLE